jgi:hypothetical protein
MELPEDDLEALKAAVASRERANPRTY